MKKEKMIFVPAAFLMTAMLAFPAMASEKIEEVTIDINAVLTASDNLEVEAEVSDDGCYVDEVSVTNEPSGDWDDDTKPKVKITIGADSDYTFSTGLSKSDVYLGNDENRVTSVTRSSSKLYVYVTLQEISEIDTEYDDEDYELDAYDLTGMTVMAALRTGKERITRKSIRYVCTGTEIWWGPPTQRQTTIIISAVPSQKKEAIRSG